MNTPSPENSEPEQLGQASVESARARKRILFPEHQTALPKDLQDLDVHTLQQMEKAVADILNEKKEDSTTLTTSQKKFSVLYTLWCYKLKHPRNETIASIARLALEDRESTIKSYALDGELERWQDTEEGRMLQRLKEKENLAKVVAEIRTRSMAIIQRDKAEEEKHAPDQVEEDTPTKTVSNAPVSPAQELSGLMRANNWEEAGKKAIQLLQQSGPGKTSALMTICAVALQKAASLGSAEIATRTRLHYAERARDTFNVILAMLKPDEGKAREGIQKQLESLPKLIEQLNAAIKRFDEDRRKK